MKTYLLPSLKLTLIFIVICSVCYPLLVAGIAQLAPGGGNGVTTKAHNTVIGYENIGQSFTADRYFNSRPSAVGYNAAGSGGSNKGASNAAYLQTVQARIDTFLAHNPGIKRSQIPADLVTASGSGLDPHISVEAARIQVKRIAQARNINEQIVQSLIDRQTAKPLLGIFGPARINVLQLNSELDQLKQPIEH